METTGWFHSVTDQVPGWLCRKCGLYNKKYGLILFENRFLKGQTWMRRVYWLKKISISGFDIVSVKLKHEVTRIPQLPNLLISVLSLLKTFKSDHFRCIYTPTLNSSAHQTI